ncbi:MAG: hypothetical protein ACFE8E_15110 [Candidatus Hodarchaeota archaeon]
MLLFENKKGMMLHFLKMGINPFEKFVSTGEIKEDLGLVNSRESLLESIINIIESKKNFILPILGNVGVGKTHLYWALKNRLYYFNTIHISLEKVYKKFFYNTYSEFIETIEVEPLRNIINQLCNRWGALERKYGFFHVADPEKVKREAFNKLQDKFGDDEKKALMDVITGIITHQLDPYKRIEAERWLLGELMNIRELSRLNLNFDLRKSKQSFIMLKILIENSKLGTILFIDDFEKIISIPRSLEEDDDECEVFDRSWLYGKKQSPNDFATRKVLEKVLKLQEIEDLRLIIILRSVESLEQLKRKINKSKTPLKLEMLEAITLQNFTEGDIYEFYLKNMEVFLQNFNYSYFYEEFPESFFPLTKDLLRDIYYKTSGNPREISKYFIKIFNELISSQDGLETILPKYLVNKDE